MTLFPRWQPIAAAAVALSLTLGARPVHAAPSPANSAIDAPLFYQLLIGELELRGGQLGTAYEVILDAARRTRDETLFRRAVDIALQGRAGDQALLATRAWRSARPESLDAVRMQLQILSALNRVGDAIEPLRTLVELTPAAERPGLVAALPRFLQRTGDRKQAADVLEQVLLPLRNNPALAVPAQVAQGRAWLAAGDATRALGLARGAAAADPTAPGPALLAMELMAERSEAEAMVLDHLKQPQADISVRLAYVAVLTQAQRLVDAATQLEIATAQKPDLPQPFLTLGAVQLELRHPREAEAALLRYVQLAQKENAAAAAAAAAGALASTGSAGASAAVSAAASTAASTATSAANSANSAAADEEDDETPATPARDLVRAWMLLAQVAEQRKDFTAAEGWLARIEEPRRTLEVQLRRATLMARQGRLEPARTLLRGVPEREPGDARAKMVAEAQMLREVQRWPEAFAILGEATQRFADDPDLLYEQAMMAEKIERLDEMERLLRRVLELRPENANAYNALGYSLADRGQRLDEAHALVVRALELMPGDPFITDSLGWVEFRRGRPEEAVKHLRSAYAARPDTEIGAHLGEVLWTMGRRDEALRIWREGLARDADNAVLRETLQRLRAQP